jgi:hypothetical protein
MVGIALAGATASMVEEGPWAIGGAVAAGAMLALYVWLEIVRPLWRRHRLKTPCKAHFTIRNPRRSLSGRDVSDGDPHLIKRLVVPANSVVDIELGILPRVEFFALEMVFGCTGGKENRPYIIEQTTSFKKTAVDDPRQRANYLDINQQFHIKIDRPYNIGSHFVTGLKLKTGPAGLYPVVVSFLTNEIEGNFFGLEFLVEDQPRSKMQCHVKKHGRNCLVSPFDL